MVCNELLTNDVITSCELCEAVFHKSCKKMTKQQSLYCKDRSYYCLSCCTVFPFQNISDDEFTFENFSVEDNYDLYKLIDNCLQFDINSFKYSDFNPCGFEKDIDPDTNFYNNLTSKLGPILFLVYINDLEEGVTGKILKFADDTKLFTKTKEIGDKQNLQDDIDKLVKWSEIWQMLFNFGKCKCLHIGPGNTSMTYEMGGTILSTTVKEKDLGVTMNANMKVSEQCRIAASKGNQVLGMIRRNITYKDKSLIVPLYKAIVRPHLEYCIQAWSPYLRKDIDMLEKIQRRATKLIPGLRDLRYEERLKECGLTTLETRRLRGDQIEVFKILNGYENIDSNIFFEIKESKITRGHNYTLVKKQSRLDVRKYSFSQRTINVWNKLSTDCVHASSVNMFKNKIDKYLAKADYT